MVRLLLEKHGVDTVRVPVMVANLGIELQQRRVLGIVSLYLVHHDGSVAFTSQVLQVLLGYLAHLH